MMNQLEDEMIGQGQSLATDTTTLPPLIGGVAGDVTITIRYDEEHSRYASYRQIFHIEDTFSHA